MVSLLGNPPEKLVSRERIYRKLNLGRTVLNAQGDECRTMNEFWGGPFFDDEGKQCRLTLTSAPPPNNIPQSLKEVYSQVY